MSTTTEAKPAVTFDKATEFGAALLQLIGEPFLFMRRSYGDELVFHFGERILGPVRKTKHGEFQYEHGTFSLHLRGSAWVVKPGYKVDQVLSAFSSDHQAEIGKVLGAAPSAASVETEATITPGARVTAVIPFPVERPPVKGIGLRVELSDGSSVVIIPTPDEPPESVPEGTPIYEIEDHKIIDWHLRTPHGILEVGPGMVLKWQYGARHGTTSQLPITPQRTDTEPVN
jgi:hypothetical protein